MGPFPLLGHSLFHKGQLEETRRFGTQSGHIGFRIGIRHDPTGLRYNVIVVVVGITTLIIVRVSPRHALSQIFSPLQLRRQSPSCFDVDLFPPFQYTFGPGTGILMGQGRPFLQASEFFLFLQCPYDVGSVAAVQ